MAQHRQIQRFHSEHTTEIKNYRDCFFQAYQSPAPDLKLYKTVRMDHFEKELMNYLPYYAQLSLSPAELIQTQYRFMLNRQLSGSEKQAAFLLRFTLGQGLYQTQALGAGRWRLWFDGYDFILALDFGPETDSVEFFGFWERQVANIDN